MIAPGPASSLHLTRSVFVRRSQCSSSSLSHTVVRRASRCQNPYTWENNGRRLFATTTSTSTYQSAHPEKSWWIRFMEWYSHQLDVNPIPTKCITCGLIAGTGDFMCQSLTAPSDRDNESVHDRRINTESPLSLFSWWDPLRTARFVCVGIVYVGPTIHVWFNWLARTFPGSHPAQVAKRVVIDQALFSPVFMAVWLPVMWTLESFSESIQGKRTAPESSPISISLFAKRLQQELFPVVVANWILWIPAQAINFRFVPIKFQVLFSNVVALLWNAYLSFYNSSSQQEAKDDMTNDQDIRTTQALTTGDSRPLMVRNEAAT